MRKYRGLIIACVAVVFNVVETIYFGCNKTALTPAEMTCDGLCSIGIIVGIFYMAWDWMDSFWKNRTINVNETIVNNNYTKD